MKLNIPLISICLPTLNARPFLEARMESILAQTVSEWELIVCDSYSNDGSWEFFQQFKDDSRVRLYQVPKEGLYAGWNECLARVRGETIYFATADDTARPTCLEKLAEALSAHPDVDLAVCGYEIIDEKETPLNPQPDNISSFYGRWKDVPHRRRGLLEFFVHAGLDTPSWVTMTAVLFRARLLEKTGLFRTDCGAMADRFWALRTALATDTFYIPEVLATWRRHSAQASNKSVPIRAARHHYKMMIEAVLEAESYLPKTITSNPYWVELLLRNSRGEYLKALGLDRKTMLKTPMAMLRGVVFASMHEPYYLMTRLLTCLTWSQKYFGEEEDYLRNLIETMQVSWPKGEVQPNSNVVASLPQKI